MIHIKSECNIDDVLVLLDFSNSLLNARVIASELDVNNARLAALEDNVLKLLHVPIEFSEDSEDVCEDTDLIKVANGHLVKLFAISFLVHAVSVVNGTLGGVLFNNTNGFITDGGLTLLG